MAEHRPAPVRVTTRDGRLVTLSEREGDVVELLLELRTEFAAVQFGSIRFDVVGPQLTGYVETSKKGPRRQMRAG